MLRLVGNQKEKKSLVYIKSSERGTTFNIKNETVVSVVSWK